MYAMPYAPDFATWLEEALKEQGITQSELARRAGVTRGAINGILQGARGPGVDLAKGIAKALDIPPEQVLRAAGLIPAAVNIDEDIETILHELDGLNEQDKAEVLAFIRMLKNLRKKNG